jgi:hypothetical protein
VAIVYKCSGPKRVIGDRFIVHKFAFSHSHSHSHSHHRVWFYNLARFFCFNKRVLTLKKKKKKKVGIRTNLLGLVSK